LCQIHGADPAGAAVLTDQIEIRKVIGFSAVFGGPLSGVGKAKKTKGFLEDTEEIFGYSYRH